MTEVNMKLEDKLNKLTDELRKSRQENDFFEPNLDQWKEELVRLKNELNEPSNVAIRHNSTPLITKIQVDISGKTLHFWFGSEIPDSLLSIYFHVAICM